MLFEEIVYRGFGPCQRKGGGFSTLGVKSEAELDAALSNGWFRTLTEAIAAHDNKAPVKTPVSEPIDQKAAQTVTVDTVSEPQTDDAPTRAELVQKCQELGINVHHRHTDATLLKLINEKLGA